jgi:hypothetical protein
VAASESHVSEYRSLDSLLDPAMSMSYAAAAAIGTTKIKKLVDFVYTDSMPSATVSVTRPPLAVLVNPNLYTTAADAQKQFSLNAESLMELDTSGELDKYAVSEANGSLVNFYHQDDMGTV